MVRVPANLSNYDATVFVFCPETIRNTRNKVYIIHFILNRKKNHNSIKFIHFVQQQQKKEEKEEKKSEREKNVN